VLFRNTLAQSISRLSGYAFSIILAPIMLAQLGLATFGVWAVTGAIAAYAGLLDFGISRSLSRFVALYETRGDRAAMRQCVGLGLIAVTAVSIASAIAAALAAPVFVDLLGELSVAEMRAVLLCSVAIFALHAYRAVVISMPIGIREMVPPSVAGLIGNVLNFAFSVGALILSTELVHYAIANVVADSLGLVVTLISLRYMSQPFGVAMPSRALTREVLGFSVKSQVNWIADLVNLQTDMVIIALLIDVRAAGAYEIAARVVAGVKSLGLLALSAMIPTATAHIAKHGRAVIADFYRRYTRQTVAIAFPIFVVTSISATYLLVAWLGEMPPDASEILVVLAMANFVNLMTGVAMTVSMGEGNAGIVAANSTLSAAMNVVLTVALAPIFGLWGVLFGTFIAISASSVIFIWRFHRRYGVPARHFFEAVGPAAGLALGLAVPFVLWLVGFGEQPGSRADAALPLLAFGTLYTVPYWVAASRLELLPVRLRLPFVGRRPAPAGTLGR